MNLYLLRQDANDDWDTYDAVVVAADTEEEATSIHPAGQLGWETGRYNWASSPSDVEVVYLGVAASTVTRGVVLASFHAG